MDIDFNRRAQELIQEGCLSEAKALLERTVESMLAGWTPLNENDERIAAAFWDDEEMAAFESVNGAEKLIVWTAGSYSKAWYQLAYIAAEEQDLERALFCVDCGLELEADHPELWNEKAYLLSRLDRHEEALECYRRAASVRNWAPATQIARSLRGQTFELVEFGRLDDAEQLLRRSLELEPGSEIAVGELEFIREERERRQAEAEDTPWFVRSLADHPTDPLTIELLALVEDLPPIPGPKTLGPENYARVSDAFLNDGWAGFEREFDRIVPRTRADYIDVKRDILREPIFNRAAHKDLADVLLGRMTVDELIDRSARTGPKKPH